MGSSRNAKGFEAVAANEHAAESLGMGGGCDLRGDKISRQIRQQRQHAHTCAREAGSQLFGRFLALLNPSAWVSRCGMQLISPVQPSRTRLKAGGGPMGKWYWMLHYLPRRGLADPSALSSLCPIRR
jgi:hypothetical protein